MIMTKSTKKIQVKEVKRYWGEFTGTLKDVQLKLQKYIDEGWEGIEDDYEYDYDGSRTIIYSLYKYRDESDAEYSLRMKWLEAEKAAKKAAQDKKNRLNQIREKVSINLTEEELKLLGL